MAYEDDIGDRPSRLRRWADGISRTVAEALCPLVILALVVHALDVVVWPQFWGRDVHIYATIAYFWQKGLIPYRDLYDFKPPLIFAVLRMGGAWWGYTAESLLRICLVLTGAAAFATYAGLRKAGYLLAAPLTALGFLTLVIVDPWHVVSQNTELLVAIFGAAAFGCAAAHEQAGRGSWAVASGACVALAAMGKQVGVLWALPVLAHLWLAGRSIRDALTRTLLWAAGFGIVVGIVVLYFAWHGAARALYDATVVDGIRYAGLRAVPWRSLPLRPTAQLAAEMIGAAYMWPFVAAIGILVPLTVLYPSRLTVVTWLWVLTAYMAAVVGPLREWHYLMSALPALAIAVGTAIEIAVGDASVFRVPSPRRLVGGVALAVLLYGSIWRAEYPPMQRLVGGAGLIEALGAQIRDAAKPSDTLFVKDEPYSLYMAADMRPMTRIFYPDSPTLGAREQWVAALERRPTFIFISYGTQQRLETATGFEGELATLLAAHYERWVTHPLGIVYRHKR